jgi:hypothetical protein
VALPRIRERREHVTSSGRLEASGDRIHRKRALWGRGNAIAERWFEKLKHCRLPIGVCCGRGRRGLQRPMDLHRHARGRPLTSLRTGRVPHPPMGPNDQTLRSAVGAKCGGFRWCVACSKA